MSVITLYFSVNVEDNGIGIKAIKNDVDFKLQFLWCGSMSFLVDIRCT